ncbi:MAG: hypothetical protein AB7F75_03525 [Planctomycetota bacterium]
MKNDLPMDRPHRLMLPAVRHVPGMTPQADGYDDPNSLEGAVIVVPTTGVPSPTIWST